MRRVQIDEFICGIVKGVRKERIQMTVESVLPFDCILFKLRGSCMIIGGFVDGRKEERNRKFANRKLAFGITCFQ